MSVEEFIRLALEEDIQSGDVTALATVPENCSGTARIVAKETGILAGGKYLVTIFKQLDSNARVDLLCKDGAAVNPGEEIARIEARGRALLSAERLALNIMQRMSGIATYTRQLTEKIRPHRAVLLDTRKTTPLFRRFEKEAVLAGGGQNHRFGLYDMVLIKENHIDLAGGITQALEATATYLDHTGNPLKVEIETRNLREVEQVLKCGKADRILLDNFSIEDLKSALSMIDDSMETEASGGINESSIQAVAATGVQYISCGALTHSSRSLDLSMLIAL